MWLEVVVGLSSKTSLGVDDACSSQEKPSKGEVGFRLHQKRGFPRAPHGNNQRHESELMRAWIYVGGAQACIATLGTDDAAECVERG